MKIKKLLIAFLLFFLPIIYVYVLVINAIPNNAILFQGETLKVRKLFGISLVDKSSGYNSILTSVVDEKSEENVQKTGTKKFAVKLFDTFNIKDINVNVIERTRVIPVGKISGLKLYTSGVLVVGMSEIRGEDNKKYKPYENSGIQEGDTIVEVENSEISDTKKLIKEVNKSEGNVLKIKYVRDGKVLECDIKPVKSSKNEYKLGLWVRDSAAGIGTLSFYEPETKKIAALGHGITDIDTGKLLNISNGEFITTKVLSIIKGKDGNPGKIQGAISNQSKIGIITKNSIFGIYGIASDVAKLNLDMSEMMDVATRDEIRLGEAKLLCSLDGENTKEYNIEIEKIYINNNYDNKSILIKVTDEELLEKTGGIIQGMSGSPVIQNGKFIGAVTNVLINDPTKGYVVFGDLMVKEMRNVS